MSRLLLLCGGPERLIPAQLCDESGMFRLERIRRDLRTPTWRQLLGSAAIRVGLFAATLALAAVAFAAALRPHNGYASLDRLLLMLAIGAAAALLAIITLGTVRHARGSLSPWSAMTSVSSLSFVLAVVIAAAVAPPVVHVIRSRSAGNDSAARADFRKWQEAVVPVVVRWMDAVRTDKAFRHGLPKGPAVEVRRRVERSEQTLSRLARLLAVEAPRLPQRPELHRLTRRLEVALSLARQAGRNYALALAARRLSKTVGHGGAERARRLVVRGNAELRRAAAIMRAFAFAANDLGGALSSGSA